MSKLNDFLLKQAIVSRDDWKKLKEDLAGCIATQAETIMAELSKLKAADYWKNPPPEEDEERYDDFETDGEPLYEVVIGDECGLTITKIAEQGWFLRQTASTSPTTKRATFSVFHYRLYSLAGLE